MGFIDMPRGQLNKVSQLEARIVKLESLAGRVAAIEAELVAEPEEAPGGTRKFSDDEKRKILERFDDIEPADWGKLYVEYGINRAHLAQWRRARTKGKL